MHPLFYTERQLQGFKESILFKTCGISCVCAAACALPHMQCRLQGLGDERDEEMQWLVRCAISLQKPFPFKTPANRGAKNPDPLKSDFKHPPSFNTIKEVHLWCFDK